MGLLYPTSAPTEPSSSPTTNPRTNTPNVIPDPLLPTEVETTTEPDKASTFGGSNSNSATSTISLSSTSALPSLTHPRLGNHPPATTGVPGGTTNHTHAQSDDLIRYTGSGFPPELNADAERGAVFVDAFERRWEVLRTASADARNPAQTTWSLSALLVAVSHLVSKVVGGGWMLMGLLVGKTMMMKKKRGDKGKKSQG